MVLMHSLRRLAPRQPQALFNIKALQLEITLPTAGHLSQAIARLVRTPATEMLMVRLYIPDLGQNLF